MPSKLTRQRAADAKAAVRCLSPADAAKIMTWLQWELTCATCGHQPGGHGIIDGSPGDSCNDCPPKTCKRFKPKWWSQ